MTVADGARMTDEGGLISVLGQQIRVKIRWGTGIPLVLCNGIGASLEVLDPVVAELNPHTTVVRFDVPGSGASPDSPLPYRFPYLACVLGNLLKKVGVLAGDSGSSQVASSGCRGRCACATIRCPEPTPMPSADPGVRRHRVGHDSRQTAGAHQTTALTRAIPQHCEC